MLQSIVLLRMLVLLLNLVVTAQAVTISGTIYCDNDFEFYFNGLLVAKDPLDFTPHNAVKVSFEWDGKTSKTYAIMCQDFATDSGYEYTETANPQLGDGALLASFDDGTKTSSSWKLFVSKAGPTAASITAGCSGSNLGACAIEDRGDPMGWYMASFNSSAWTAATQYTANEAGWGRTPMWQNGKCCTVTSPLTRTDLGCSMNTSGTSVVVTADECLDPRASLESSGAQFIWGSELETDNRILFRCDSSCVGTSVGSSGGTANASTTSRISISFAGRLAAGMFWLLVAALFF